MAKILIKYFDPKESKFTYNGEKYPSLQHISLVLSISNRLGGREKVFLYESLKKDLVAAKHSLKDKSLDVHSKQTIQNTVKDLEEQIAPISEFALDFLEKEKIFANPKLEFESLKYFSEILPFDLKNEALQVIFNSSFNMPQMKVVAAGYYEGLQEEQIKVFAVSKFDALQMTFLKAKLVEGIPMDLVKALADPKHSVAEMETIFDAITSNEELLTDEGRALMIQKHLRDKELSSQVEVNIELDSVTSKWTIDGKEISEERLTRLVTGSSEPKVFEIKKELYLNSHTKDQNLPILDMGVASKLSLDSLTKIAFATDPMQAKNIFIKQSENHDFLNETNESETEDEVFH